MKLAATILTTALVIAATQAPAAQPSAPGTVIVPARSRPSQGPADRFTGTVTVDTAFTGTGGSAIGGGRVTFQPGARSNWHTHPLGQLLIVTEGRALVGEEGRAVRIAGPGDVVWTAPGVKHWHGATPDAPMAHYSVNEAVNGKAVEWMEPVTDAQYGQAPQP